MNSDLPLCAPRSGRSAGGRRAAHTRGSSALRWRRWPHAHASPPALLGILASGGGSGPGRRKQEGENGSDPPVQRRLRSPNGPRRAINEEDTTRNSVVA